MRSYLRIRHAAGVVLASQLMALLIVAIVLFGLPQMSPTMLDQYNELFRTVRRAWQGF
jgi:hypothetical protein